MKKIVLIISLLFFTDCWAQIGKIDIQYFESNKEYCDTVYFYFRDGYNNRRLNHCHFGVNTDKEELPIHYVFKRDYFGEIEADSVILIRHKINRYNPKEDKLYGYFSCQGYYGTGEGRRFIIPNNMQKIILNVTPKLSKVTLKAHNPTIDSIRYTIIKEKIEEYNNKYAERYIVSPDNIWQTSTTIITPQDFNKEGLNITSYEIYPNDYFMIDIVVYRNGRVDYQQHYEVKYQLWTETVIDVW